MSRRWRGHLARRGKFFEPPWPQITPAAPAWIPEQIQQAGQSSRRLGRSRSGQFAEPPWPQVVTAAPTWVPGLVDQAGSRPRWAALIRRGRFWGTPATVGAPGTVQWPGRAVRRVPSVRRGDRFDPPWPPVVQAPSVWTPPIIQAIRRLAGRPVRRGQHFEPPWPQIAQAPPPPAIPQTIRPRVRLPFVRRGQFNEPPWPAIAAPTPPAFVPRLLATHRPQPGTPRRGRFPTVPLGQGQPPAFVCIRRRGFGVRSRRGRLFDPPWPPPQPSVWRPGPVRARRRAPAVLARRGQFVEPPWPAIIITTPVPRWVEGASGGSSINDASGGGVAVLEGAGAGTGAVDGTSGGSGMTEGTGGASGIVEGRGGV
jgi:hypothetical protein